MLAREWGVFLGGAISGVFGPPVQALLTAARAVKDFVVPILKVPIPHVPCFHTMLCSRTLLQTLFALRTPLRKVTLELIKLRNHALPQ